MGPNSSDFDDTSRTSALHGPEGPARERRVGVEAQRGRLAGNTSLLRNKIRFRTNTTILVWATSQAEIMSIARPAQVT